MSAPNFGSKAHTDALKEMRMAQDQREVAAETLTDEEILDAACPDCLAPAALWCYVEAIDRLGPDGMMRDHVVHGSRIAAARRARRVHPTVDSAAVTVLGRHEET